MKNVILLEESKGIKKEYFLVSLIKTNDNKDYVIYTNNEKDEDGFIKLYAGRKENDFLFPIKNEKELEMIEKFLIKLDEECE